jgi:hypothetical protein
MYVDMSGVFKVTPVRTFKACHNLVLLICAHRRAVLACASAFVSIMWPSDIPSNSHRCSLNERKFLMFGGSVSIVF